jgi:hypothetical protein
MLKLQVTFCKIKFLNEEVSGTEQALQQAFPGSAINVPL